MTDPTYDAESHHTPESRDRDARFVGHEVKTDTSKEMVEQARKALHKVRHERCTNADREAVVYWAECGEYVLSEDYNALLDERDALREEAEGAHAVILAERAEVLKLREENERLREALLVYADPCDATETKPCGYEGNMCCMTARAALKGEQQ